MNEIHAFNIKIHPLRKNDFIQYIENSISNNARLVQSGVNAASIVEIKNNKLLIDAYNNSDLINIDGMSMVWALRFLGFTVPERVACPDLAMGIMDMAQKNSYKLFMFGAEESNLNAAVENVRKTFPKLLVAGYRNGFFNSEDEARIVEMINSAHSDILFMGMPSPRKEFFVEKYKDQLNVKYILGVGGFFDILSGSINRAPIWMQNMGLEWFYRLIKEPKRMWRRYLIGNTTFIKLVLLEKIRRKK
jgi:N-acetylglucosaminyldiphosphoundecaprenol N-acetyl-beta-D-mannosaminyltransferase